MPKKSRAAANAGDSTTSQRRSDRLMKRPLTATTETAEPKQKIKKAPPKPKKVKEAEKAKPEEDAEAPAENGEAKDEAPSTDEDKKAEDAE